LPLLKFQPSYNCSWGSSSPSKWPDHEPGHPRRSTAEVKHKWRYTSTPPICLSGAHKFTFNF